jgi:hypothetical protein
MTTKPYRTEEAVQIVKRAAAGRRKLLDELRSYTTDSSVKRANLGGEPGAGFEQSFASLAYTYVQEKAPALADFMIGFQLVDKSEDNQKAVGIFGFKIGSQWAYVPVFFLHGNLKGHELLYLKNQDTFVPLKENWVNYLLSKKPHVLGEMSRGPQDLHQMGMMEPDMRSLALPPDAGKFASYQNPNIKSWAKPIMPKLAAWVTESPGANPARLNLRDFIKEDVEFAKLAVRLCKKYPSIKAAMDDLHGADMLRDTLLEMKDNFAKLASKSVLNAPVKDAAPRSRSILKSAAAEEPKKLEIKTDVITTDHTEASESDREKLLRDGYLINDHRKGEEVSVAYNTQVELALSNPDSTDVYEVLVKPGGFKKCLIVHNPHGGDGRKRTAMIVDLDSKKFQNCHPTKIFAKQLERGKSDVEEYKDWFEGLENSSSLTTGATYCVLAPNGQGTSVFEVREDLGEDCYRVNWRSFGWDERPDYLPDLDRSPSRYSLSVTTPTKPVDVIYFNKREGTGMRSINGKLYLPNDVKTMKLKDPPSCKKCSKGEEDCTCDYFHHDYDVDNDPIKPGNLVDLQMEIMQKTSAMKIWCDHNEVVINQKRMSKLAGLFHLVKDHGLREKQAKRMLKEAEKFGGMRYRIKYANPYAAMEGPGAPGFPGAEYGSMDLMGQGIPTMDGPQVNFEQVPELAAGNTDQSVYDPMQMVDPMAMQSAQQAAQMGQKDVFDTTMISSMLKAVREDSIVDRYLGDLTKALDRLGRILFMFYWHNEEFMNRYGKQDLPELEDTIRNAFEMLGDLVLYLKQKTIDSGSMGMDLGSNLS